MLALNRQQFLRKQPVGCPSARLALTLDPLCCVACSLLQPAQLCFVEFEQQEQATLAMATLDGYLFDHAEGPTGTRLKVAFAKSHGGGAAGAGSGGGGADRRSPRERDPRDDRGGGGGGGGGRRRSRSPMRR